MPRDISFQILGFIVKASVDGKKGFQPISQRFTARSAADSFRELALKQGFADAFVTEVTGLEAMDKVRDIRRRNQILPPIKA